MKTPSKFLIYDLRLTIWKKSPANRQSSIVNRQSSGMALVLTLIMLSVILVMVVAFLAISRRERNAVSTTTDTAIARFAADSALAAAQAQIVGNILSSSAAAYNYHLLVSTNYIDSLNTNYNLFNIGNNLPCPPVMTTVDTNYIAGRFYLDLNRNGKFDPSGWVAELDSTGATNGNQVLVVGDPEWIGVLERPDAPHANNNKFISRYAFLAQPIGNGLDLNHIHNQTLSAASPNPFNIANDGYFRNEGVGSWELNLAGFLADLNTNQWGQIVGSGASAPPGCSTYYQYLLGDYNHGHAFEDSQSIIAWRYANNYNTLAIPSANMFSGLVNGGIDGYTVGNLMASNSLPPVLTPLNTHWAGSNNTNRFFALLSELPDPTNSSVAFTNRLLSAGFGKSTYDSYTFYRLLDQMGTDSAVDDGRMNLNYDNLDTSGNVVSGAETNLIAWTPLRFFTNAANRLLTNFTTKWLASNSNSFAATFNTTTPFGLTNIPVLVSNQFVYTPAVNRLLQLAANIYDATTNSPYPSVFRPMFSRIGTNVFITGYAYVPSVTGTNDPAFLTPFDAAQIAVAGGTNVLENVYGVPWIIGAKKGLPNFNQLYLLDAVQVTRKLQVTKPSFSAPLALFQTNQMYIFGISNVLGFSLWNSYTNTYNTNITIVARDFVTMWLTNNAPGFVARNFVNYPIINVTNSILSWAGTKWQLATPATVLDPTNHSFIPYYNSAVLLTNSIYRYAAPPYFDTNTFYQTNVWTPQLPQFGLQTTNRLQVFIIAGGDPVTGNNGHIIDYVHFAGPECHLDINAELANPKQAAETFGGKVFLWDTNVASPGSSTPLGVVNQIAVSQQGGPDPLDESANFWQAPPNLPAYLPQTKAAEQAFFTGFFDINRLQYGVYIFNNKRYTNSETHVQAPYTPTRLIYTNICWQVNDPLVHYLASDLNYSDPHNQNSPSDDPAATLQALFTVSPGTANSDNLTNLTARFSPWGKRYPYANQQNSVDDTWMTQMKDSLVWRSDEWDFPANPYPTVGWLGRVHRGTPWQTVYLKSADILGVANGSLSWSQWTGNNLVFDATNSAPLADEALFDLFSTALHPNATFGTLSINQTNFAAWSAVFSGVVVPTNTLGGYTIVSPAGADGSSSPLGQIVASIIATRTNLPSGVFTRLGDILSTPVLTEQSPFLLGLDSHTAISDELYEWLPQQTLGLLRISTTPRYVIYCYGQTLRPAANSIVTSGGSLGLVTNYQIVAESAARAVVRVDKHATTTGTNYSTVIESYDQLPPQ